MTPQDRTRNTADATRIPVAEARATVEPRERAAIETVRRFGKVVAFRMFCDAVEMATGDRTVGFPSSSRPPRASGSHEERAPLPKIADID